MSDAKTNGIFFFQKKSWSQMIQKNILRIFIKNLIIIIKNVFKWPENVKFRRKWRFFGGSDGSNLQNQQIRLCNQKTQLLSRITFTVSLKIKPDNQMYANMTDPPPPPYYFLQLTITSKKSYFCDLFQKRKKYYE